MSASELEADIRDELHLEALGYKQELKRGLGFWGSVGITLGAMQPLASAGVFQLGMLFGGPAVVVYGFLGCFLFGIPMALSMAEIASPFTSAGGPYFWSGALAGELGRIPPFVVGWVILVAFFGGLASIALQSTQQAVAMHMMYYGGFPSADASDAKAPATTQNAQYGITIFTLCVCAFVSAFPTRVINKLAHVSFGWLVLGALLIVICVPAVAPANGINPLNGQYGPLRQTGKWVFATDPDMLSASTQANGVFTYAGLGSRTAANAYTVCNGFLMAQYLILIFDTPGHMAEETHDAAKTVPRAILFSYFAGAALNFGLLLSYLFSVTNVNNAAIPGFGVTGTCPTINVPTLEYMAANGGALPGFDATSEMLYMSGFGDLPAWSSNSFAGVPNDGVPLFSAKGACILSNGLPFSLFPIGNVFYDAFAARYPLCTPSEAFGSATWEYDASSGSLVNTTSFTGRYNVNSCLPINTPASQIPAGATACCDVTGAIAPSKAGRGGAIFFAFIIFGGSILSICSIFVAGSRFIYSFARDRGFPGPLNRVLSYVEPRTKAPLNAILMYLIAGIAFTAAWTNTSPTVAFNAVSGLVSNGFYMVYGLPSLLRFTWARKTFKATAAFSLGRLSIPMAILSTLYGAFANATIALPSFFPITANTVNYAPIILAAVILMALCFLPFALDVVPCGWGYRGPAHTVQKPGLPEAVEMTEAPAAGVQIDAN